MQARPGARHAQPPPPGPCAARGRTRACGRRSANGEGRARGSCARGNNPNFAPDEQAIFTAVVDLVEKLARAWSRWCSPRTMPASRWHERHRNSLRAKVIFGDSGRLEPDIQAEAFAIRW